MEIKDFETRINEMREKGILPSSFSIDEFTLRAGMVQCCYGHCNEILIVWGCNGLARSSVLGRVCPLALALDPEDNKFKRIYPIKTRRDKKYDLKF